MPKVSKEPAPGKAKPPKKPRRDFPLFAHQNGCWAKKIKGKLYYFGTWAEPEAAEAKYNRDATYRHKGETPPADPNTATVRDVCNAFEKSKRHLRDTREITPKTYADYFRTCTTVCNVFGKGRHVSTLKPHHFEQLRAELAKTRGPVGLANEITRVRVLFKYAIDQGIIDRPVHYGQSFSKPTKKVLRQARHDAGPRMFEAAEICAILDAAGVQLKAMTLLGINCGFGNTDVATLPIAAIDQRDGWADFPRSKTAIPRRVKLWPETVKAIKAAIDGRPAPKSADDGGLVFITRLGHRWVRFNYSDATTNKGQQPSGGAAAGDGEAERQESWIDSVGLEFNKLLKSLKLKRPGLGFYALRHTFETIAGETADQVAVDAIMGHAPASNDMSAVYRERISDQRLAAVAEHVRRWLFPKPIKRGKK